MIKSVLLAFALSALVAASCAAGPIADDAVVAKVGDEAVTYRQIRCDNALLAEGATRGSGECLKYEQRRLDRLLITRLIDRAAEQHSLALTAAEQAEVEKRVLHHRKTDSAGVAKIRRLVHAALLVAEGADRREVYERHLKPDFRPAELDNALQQMPDAATLRAFLARDLDAEAERQSRDHERRVRIQDKLKAHATARATEMNVTVEAAEQTMWDEAISAYHVRIIDPRYKLPDMKGVLDVQSSVITHRVGG